MSNEASTNHLNPLIGVDVPRLEKEMERYQQILDDHADHAYRVAEEARPPGLDSKTIAVIARAHCLAGRT